MMKTAACWLRLWPVLLLYLAAVAWAQQQRNPFLVHRQQQQKQQHLPLQQQSPPQRPRARPRNPPSSKSGSPTSPRKIDTRQLSDEGETGRRGGVKGRNEMHKGPTAWTRWTPSPRSNISPWEDQQGGARDTAVCGGRRYSPRDNICCQNQLHNRQGLRPACCGHLAFDFVFSLCCDGTVTPRTAGKPFCA